MKKVILSLIASTFALFANNEIYLDQSGGSGTFTIKQDGTTNNLGASTKRSKLTGDAKTLTSITTGTGNEVYLDEVGNSTTTEILITGNANKLDSKVKVIQTIQHLTLLETTTPLQLKLLLQKMLLIL